MHNNFWQARERSPCGGIAKVSFLRHTKQRKRAVFSREVLYAQPDTAKDRFTTAQPLSDLCHSSFIGGRGTLCIPTKRFDTKRFSIRSGTRASRGVGSWSRSSGRDRDRQRISNLASREKF